MNTEDHRVFDATYKSLLDHLIENYMLPDEKTESILLFAKIRHLLVHKGFPNPHIAPSENSRDIAKGHPFTADDVKTLAERLQNPRCYPDLRESHRTAIKAIDSLEKEFVHNFGFMQISKMT